VAALVAALNAFNVYSEFDVPPVAGAAAPSAPPAPKNVSLTFHTSPFSAKVGIAVKVAPDAIVT
jgi:hypothetical protein